MSTFLELVDAVKLNLTGFTADQEERTALLNPISPTDLILQADEPKLLSQGMVEIGDELMWLKKVDNSTGQLTVSPFGRGYRSTPASSHPAGVAIVNAPKFPTSVVKKTINTVLDYVYPELYVLKSIEFPYIACRSTYELPADCTAVHHVRHETIGPSKAWLPMNRWNYVPDADTTMFPNGKAIDLWQGIVPGRAVRVTYMSPPSGLVNDGDQFSTTGLDFTGEDVAVYGACYRLCAWLEPPRLQMQAIESTLRTSVVPTTSATKASQYFYGLFQDALQGARAAMLHDNPSPTHFRYV